MSEKSYDSVMYYAQEFRDLLINEKFMQREYGGIFQAKQSSNNVSFRIGEISSHVKFEYRAEKPYMILEMELVNGGGNQRTETIEKVMKIRRSKTGRISGSYYPKVLSEFIFPNMSRFYDKWKSSPTNSFISQILNSK